MSDDDVHGHEMNDPHDFDDATANAFLSGSGREIDAGLADLLGDMRVAYTSTPPVIGTELSALMGATQPVPAQSVVSRRFEQMRSSMLAKIGVGVAAFAAATGSLAVAHALPAPVQDAVSHLGVGSPAHHHGHAASLFEDSSTTTTVDPTVTVDPTPTTGEPGDNHGGEVSSVAKDHSTEGCEHGGAVSAVASGGKSNNDAPCETTTTIAGGTTPTSADDNQSGDNQGNDAQSGDAQSGDNQGDTPTTTDAPGVTPTTEVHDGGSNKSDGGGGSNSSDSNSGDSGSGGGDTSGGSGASGGN